MIGVAILGGCALAAALLFSAKQSLLGAIVSSLFVFPLWIVAAVLAVRFCVFRFRRGGKAFGVAVLCLLLLPLASAGGRAWEWHRFHEALPRYTEIVRGMEKRTASFPRQITFEEAPRATPPFDQPFSRPWSEIGMTPADRKLGISVDVENRDGALTVIFLTGGCFAGHSGYAYRAGGWREGQPIPQALGDVLIREIAPGWIAF